MSRDYIRNVVKKAYAELCEAAVIEMFLPARKLVLNKTRYYACSGDILDRSCNAYISMGCNHEVSVGEKDTLESVFERFLAAGWIVKLEEDIYSDDTTRISLDYATDDIAFHFSLEEVESLHQDDKCKLYAINSISYSDTNGKIHVMYSGNDEYDLYIQSRLRRRGDDNLER